MTTKTRLIWAASIIVTAVLAVLIWTTGARMYEHALYEKCDPITNSSQWVKCWQAGLWNE